MSFPTQNNAPVLMHRGIFSKLWQLRYLAEF